jgi:hypothetical protein
MRFRLPFLRPKPSTTPQLSERFENFIPFVLIHEGGTYENDPDDPGGETKWGIDKRSHPDVDIPGLTQAGATKIYYDSYWTPNHCESLQPKLGESHMDAAVNCGTGRANRFLAAAHGDVGKYLNERDAFYHRLAAARPRSAKYLRGWLNRTRDLRHFLQIT